MPPPPANQYRQPRQTGLRLGPLAVLLLSSLGVPCLLGCLGDEIKRYQVPKPETHPEPEPKVRLLAAIFPAKDRTWFFKFSSPTGVVKENEGAYNRLVRTVRLADDEEKPISWTLPDGWRFERSNKPLRYGTFQFGPPDRPVEVTLSALGREAGTLLDNVNRWRKEIGLKPAAQAELPKLTRSDEINGVAVILVDMAGPGGGNMGMGR